MSITEIEHLNGDSPEQRAVDLMRATFSALNEVPSQNDFHTFILARCQERMADSLGCMKEAWLVI